MRINNQESEFLYQNKLNNGSDPLKATKQIEKLKGYELGLTEKNKIIRKLENEIINLKTQIESLKHKLNVKANKDFKENFKLVTGELSNKDRIKLKHYETRIMNILKEEEKILLSTLTKLCGMKTKERDIVLKKLEEEKKIIIKHDRFTAVYLNKENECG